MKRILVIKDKSKVIHFRNRQLRTPVTLQISDREIPQVKVALHAADIKHYEVKDIKDSPPIDYNSSIENEEVLIEELDIQDTDEEPKTILEKLMSGE